MLARKQALHEKLVALATACEASKESEPLTRFTHLWNLYEFLDDVDPVELFVSLGTKLSDMESTLTTTDKIELRKLGVCFPEDWDKPRELFQA